MKKSGNQEKIIAIYARESTREQAEKGFNMDTQIRKIKEYIKLYEIEGKIKIYEDRGVSAKTTNRPSLNKLKEDIKCGLVSYVIVQKLDRLVRRLRGLDEFIELFNNYDINFVSLHEKLDTRTAVGVLMANIVCMIAQWEEDTISERTNDGLVEGAEQGYYVKGQKPFGYDKVPFGEHKILRLNKEEKRVIHKMRDLLKAGYSLYMIKMILKNDSYLKSIDKDYCENMIVRILKQKINIGIMEFKGKEYKLQVETVFTDEEYEEVLQLLAERKKASKYNYLLAGKVRNADGKLSSLKSTKKPNSVYLYYFDDITKKRINENKLLDDAIKIMRKNQTVYKNFRGCSYQTDVKKIKDKKSKLKKLYDLTNITTDLYKEELLKIEKEEHLINDYYIKYVKELSNTFYALKDREKELFVWKHINYIEVDYSMKEIKVS